MLEAVRKAVGEAITARIEGRLEARKGQRHIAQEFGLTQADVSLFATGQWQRMTLDKMLRIAEALHLGFSGAVVVVPEGDGEFSADLARIKAAIAGDAELQQDKRLEALRARKPAQKSSFAEEGYS